MKNVLGKLLVIATVSVITLGVGSESEYPLNQSYEISIENPFENETYDINIIPEDDPQNYHNE